MICSLWKTLIPIREWDAGQVLQWYSRVLELRVTLQGQVGIKVDFLFIVCRDKIAKDSRHKTVNTASADAP